MDISTVNRLRKIAEGGYEEFPHDAIVYKQELPPVIPGGQPIVTYYTKDADGNLTYVDPPESADNVVKAPQYVPKTPKLPSLGNSYAREHRRVYNGAPGWEAGFYANYTPSKQEEERAKKQYTDLLDEYNQYYRYGGTEEPDSWMRKNLEARYRLGPYYNPQHYHRFSLQPGQLMVDLASRRTPTPPWSKYMWSRVYNDIKSDPTALRSIAGDLITQAVGGYVDGWMYNIGDSAMAGHAAPYLLFNPGKVLELEKQYTNSADSISDHLTGKVSPYLTRDSSNYRYRTLDPVYGLWRSGFSLIPQVFQWQGFDPATAIYDKYADIVSGGANIINYIKDMNAANAANEATGNDIDLTNTYTKQQESNIDLLYNSGDANGTTR